VIAANVPVGLISTSDPLTGSAVYNWTVNLGNADSQDYTVGIVVGGFYTRNNSGDDTVVTVSKPLDAFITGGGYFINQGSAGTYAGDTGLRTNFGFNVKYNNKLTNLQGHLNVIVRENGVTYQIKTNSMTSLVVDPVTNKATFVSKANLQDITNPTNPISLGGNLTMIATLTDAGEPGNFDTIGFTLWNGTQLLYSSQWNGTQTIEQLLAGGNIVVHSNPNKLEAVTGMAVMDGQHAFTELVSPLTEDTLGKIVQKAVATWANAPISESQLRELQSTHFRIADLSGATLGETLGNTIWIDDDGAGRGWFTATDRSPVNASSFDLLTVVNHELGHILGLEHSSGNDVMHADLATGVRMIPSSNVNIPSPPNWSCFPMLSRIFDDFADKTAHSVSSDPVWTEPNTSTDSFRRKKASYSIEESPLLSDSPVRRKSAYLNSWEKSGQRSSSIYF